MLTLEEPWAWPTRKAPHPHKGLADTTRKAALASEPKPNTGGKGRVGWVLIVEPGRTGGLCSGMAWPLSSLQNVPNPQGPQSLEHT